MTQGQQPEALRLATALAYCDSSVASQAAAELRRLHAENVTLQQGYDAARLEIDSLQARVQELGAMLRENRSKRIVELEAQLEAIGAGGVEPLRRRECLHQIVEPAPAGEYPALPGRTADELGDPQRQTAIAAYRAAHGHEPDFGFAPDRAWIEGAAYIDADRAMRAKAAPDCDTPRYCQSVQRCTAQDEKRAAPAAAAGPSDEAIEDFLASRMSAEGRIPMIMTIREALTHFAAPTTQAAPQPAVQQGDAEDAAFEAVRHQLCGLQRYSFALDDDGVVRRVKDRTGRWIEFDDAHELFDPVAVDAASSQAKEGGAA